MVNIVGQGSIEEGKLSVLAFKKSLFAGVLDGGEAEVFMQGTRLSQFMHSVEAVAGSMGEADADGVDAGTAAMAVATAPADASPMTQPAADRPDSPTRAAEPADPWAAILEAGAAMLQGLASARAAGGPVAGAAPFTIERDPATGQASIRLPLPDAAVLQRLARAFEPWLR